MFIKSSISNIKLQLGLILSPKNYNLMTGLSLYKWVLSSISILLFCACFCLEHVWSISLYLLCDCVLCFGRYRTQLGRRGFGVSALPFIEGQIVVFLYTMLMSWNHLILLTIGMKNFSNRLVIHLYLIAANVEQFVIYLLFFGLFVSVSVCKCKCINKQLLRPIV